MYCSECDLEFANKGGFKDHFVSFVSSGKKKKKSSCTEYVKCKKLQRLEWAIYIIRSGQTFRSPKRYKVKQKKSIILLSGKFVTFFRHISSVHLRNTEIKRSKNDAQEIHAFELKWTLSRWSDSILGKSLISSLAFIPLS